MRAFQRQPTLSSKERTERRRNATIYHNLRSKPTTAQNSQTYQVVEGNKIISNGFQAKYNMIQGREHYLQTHGTPTQLERVYGKQIIDEHPFQPQHVQDYQYRKFNADITNIPGDYPGNDDSTEDAENYIYNLPYNIYYDNANNDNTELPNSGEMTQEVYDTYKFFTSYPYIVDASGNIDYQNFDDCNNGKMDQYFVVSETSGNTIYQNPKSLIRQPLELD